jgi:hypothetical protein
MHKPVGIVLPHAIWARKDGLSLDAKQIFGLADYQDR